MDSPVKKKDPDNCDWGKFWTMFTMLVIGGAILLWVIG